MNNTTTILQTITMPFDMTVRLAVQDADIQSWCIALSMMQNKIVDEIIIKDAGSLQIITLKATKLSRKHISLYTKTQKNFNINLTRMELERWLCFLLDYARVGSATADHLDLELKSEMDALLPDLNLILKVSNLKFRN